MCYRDFHKVNYVKEEAIMWAISEGYEVALTDADIVWTKNPMQDLRDSLFGFDYAFQTAQIDGEGRYNLNGGFLYVKPTGAAINALQLLLLRLFEVTMHMTEPKPVAPA